MHVQNVQILFFIVKHANLWGFCCRRRRGCLSSLTHCSDEPYTWGRTENVMKIANKLTSGLARLRPRT